MTGVAPNSREAPRFVKLAALLFAMFEIPLWALIFAVACVIVLLLLYTHVSAITLR